jgi:predicted alpha/beta superfamily hydrolase
MSVERGEPDSPDIASPLGDTEVIDLWSTQVQDTFRIFLGRCGQDPETAVFVTDANGMFGLAVDIIRLMQIPALVPSIVVVGLGYPEAAAVADTIELRTRDLTPTPMRQFRGSGGGDDFLSFIRSQLIPWTRHQFPSVTTIVYFGHSLGGLFGVHALLADPPAFDAFILGSPALWWDDYAILKREAECAVAHSDLAARVYVGIGSLETDDGRRTEAANLPIGHYAKPGATNLDMVDDLERFEAVLRSRAYPSLELTCAVFPDEFHATVASTVLSHGIRQIFGRT